MNTTYIIIAVVLILLVAGAIVLPILNRSRRSQKFHEQYGTEYDRTVELMGNEKDAQAELDLRRKHVEAMDIRPLSLHERERYLADWTSMQAKFVDEPRESTVEADRLIMEVMQLRDYPLADFEQRAADISISYPALVTNYRAARDTAIRNEDHHAGTEDLRLAMLNYRSLFEELIKTDAVAEVQEPIALEAQEPVAIA